MLDKLLYKKHDASNGRRRFIVNHRFSGEFSNSFKPKTEPVLSEKLYQNVKRAVTGSGIDDRSESNWVGNYG